MPINIGLGEVIVVLIVALVVFGGRLPEVGRSLGQALVQFKAGMKTAPEDYPEEEEEEEALPPTDERD